MLRVIIIPCTNEVMGVSSLFNTEASSGLRSELMLFPSPMVVLMGFVSKEPLYAGIHFNPKMNKMDNF